MQEPLIERLSAHFGAAIVSSHAHRGDATLVLDPAALRRVATELKEGPAWAFDVPIDCTAVDYLGQRTPRFEVVWHLYSTAHRQRLRLKVLLDEAAPQCASLTPVWPGMNWHEREVWDLYGIRLQEHPNLVRVLMYDEFVGHPLRKDYPITRRQPLVPMREVRQVPTQREPPPELLNRP